MLSENPINQFSESSAVQFENQTTSELLNYLDVEPEFRQVIADLSGQIWNPEKERFVNNPHSRPLMNANGIQAVVLSSRSYFSKSAIINDFDEKMIYKLMWSYAQFVKKMITYKEMRNHYGINPVDRWLIVEILLKSAFLNLNRSLHRHELDALTKFIKSAENVSHAVQTKPNKWNPFNILPFRRKT